MEQPTIFEDQFETAFIVRRRSLLSIFLKLYIWAGFIIAGIFVLAVIVAILSAIFLETGNGEDPESLAARMGLLLFLAGFIFSLTGSVWFEKKWAIRYNMIVGRIWGIYLIASLIMGTLPPTQIIILLFTLPYWFMLYKIRERWEKRGISKKDLTPIND
ncbi:hypothetical protein [Chitinophaga sp.]|uniref:hypothetical protein n=1 Tax=Chitinophaga sp. TaxID=1869181 RepID=UPI0031DD7B5D